VATLRYDIDVDARRAEARIGAFALNMRRQITQAVRSLPEIEITADSSDAQRELATVRRELVELGNQRVGIDISAEEAQRKLDALTERLKNLRQTGDIQIDADVRAALEQLGIVDAAVDRIDGRRATVKVDVDKSFADTIIKVAQLGRALGTIVLPVAAVNIIPVIAGIAASIGDLSGVAGLLPAAGFAAAAAIGTIAVGFAHVNDALGPTGTAAQLKKVNEALAALPPEARGTVQAIRDLGPAWSSVRMDVQTKLFQGMREQVQGLAKVELPVLKTGLGGIATELNLSARNFLDWVKSAQTTKDVNTLFAATRDAMHQLIPAGANVAAAILDIGAVGAKFLPGLASGFTAATARFREFIDQARQSGALEQWIQTGIDKVNQLGRVLANAGGAVAGFFKAANASGHDFLDTAERLSAELDKFINAPTTQMGIIGLFTATGEAIDNALPGVREFADAFARAVQAAANSQGLQAAGQAITDISHAVSPLLPQLGALAGQALHGLATEASAVAVVLGPVVHFLGDMLTAVGPIGPAVLAMGLAFRVLSPINGIVTGLGVSLGGLATRFGASEEAAGRIASTFSKVGSAIPLLGVAIIGLGVLYDALRDKTNDTAAAILKGSQDFSAAVDEQVRSMQASQESMAAVTDESSAMAAGIAGATGKTIEAKSATELHTEAVNRMVAAMTAQVDEMSGVEQAQGRVKIAQVEWNEAVKTFGPNSDQAAAAAANLATASFNLKAAQDQASNATKTLTDRIVENSQASSAAANADVGYQQAVINVSVANDNAAKVAANRSSSERDLAAANLQVMQANLSAADAARRKAEADGTAAGASNVAQLGAQAYKEELIRLANQATGPTRDALLAMANGTDTAARAASSSELAARAEKDELGRLAGMADGTLRNAINGAIQNFDSLGGAHATAQQKAQAQKDELNRLAGMASGPVKQALTDMANQVKTLPDGDFQITATGVTAYKFSSTGEVLGTGNTGLATGGILPGYTPGRDVQRFRAANGSTLDLSGGEAIMRPEWTRAVSPAYVSAANAAARTGGVAGVQNFIGRTTTHRGHGEGFRGDGSKFSDGGIFGQHARYAMGGLVNMGALFPSIVPTERTKMLDELRKTLIAEVQPKIKAHEAAAKAALAAAALGGGGPVTAGAQAGLDWARTQVGKPYIWGAVGPGGYDCSGFMSAIVNVMRGKNPYSRVGATANFPWAGFQPGMGAGLSIGAFKGNPGHMAGTIGGTNVESSGSVGVRVGGGARGAANGMFTVRAHLADRGAMLPHGEAAINLSGMPERVLDPVATRQYSGDSSMRIVDEVSALRGDVQTLQSALPGGGDTFNIYAENAQEGAHASRMLLRSMR
jgi:hypothetical protein